LNEDGIVNIADLGIVAIALWSEPGHPDWNPVADLNQDDFVNMIDLVLVAQNYKLQTGSANPSARTRAWNEGLNGGRATIKWYYWLHDGDGKPNAVCQRIAESRPTMLYCLTHLWTAYPWGPGTDCTNGFWGGMLNLTPEISDLLHSYNVKIFAYVRTDGGNRDLYAEDGVFAQMEREANLDIDGFKIDEVFHFSPHLNTPDGWKSDPRYAYYKAIYDKCKSYELPCLMNTGTFYNSELLMELCDILGMEGGWETFVADSRFEWRKKYDRYRFEGYNDERDYPFTVTSGLDQAVSVTLDAWDNGIGYHHCSVNRKTLPDWWEEYMRRIGFE